MSHHDNIIVVWTLLQTMKTLIDALHKQELEEVMKDNELAINNLRATMHQQQQTELEQLFLQHKTETG